MNFLDYIKLANSYQLSSNKEQPFSIGLITNFTDDVLLKVLTGVCLKNYILPDIYKVPYKQYRFALKDQNDKIWQSFRLIFFFIDTNFYLHSEFFDGDDYGNSLLDDLEFFLKHTSSTVVANTFLLPYAGPGGNQINKSLFFQRIKKLNERFYELAKKYSNLEIFELNRLAQIAGERQIRDLRGLYAFDSPFTNDFLTYLAEEWFVYVMALSGRVKKLIVLDLDNILWGGVVGELGPLGISLGPGYPGLVFQNFQRALLEYQKAGILLAINSKNNPNDVEEVFEKNPHMILQKKHFVSIIANWEDKFSNMMVLSKQLNLGLESFVFFDDEPMQRELIKASLPQVLVPDLDSQHPEQYLTILNNLAVFNPFSLTAEDASKDKLYKEEQKRQVLQNNTSSLEDFIKSLKMVLDVSVNNTEQIPRISQLTLKTNQFNVTTHRYNQKEIEQFMDKGLVFTANLKDRFGDYGLTALAVFLPDVELKEKYTLDTFLMSCRILGRSVEFSFIDFIIRWMFEKYGTKNVIAEFIPTLKNIPAKDFFAKFGFENLNTATLGKKFRLNVQDYYAKENKDVYKSITVNLLTTI
jgi:FkbH-like protein